MGKKGVEWRAYSLGASAVSTLQGPAAVAADADLLRRYVESADREAMGCLFLRHADAAYRLAHRLILNASDAEDAAQSAYTEILRNAGKFNPNGASSVKAWMMGFVVNICQHKIRERSRRLKRDSHAARERSAAAAEPESSLKDLQEVVRGAVDKLPAHYRLPVWLHYYEGLSTSDVAEALRRPHDTIRKQIARGLEQLRSALAAAGSAAVVPNLTEFLAGSTQEAAPESLRASVEAFVQTGAYPPLAGHEGTGAASSHGAEAASAPLKKFSRVPRAPAQGISPVALGAGIVLLGGLTAVALLGSGRQQPVQTSTLQAPVVPTEQRSVTMPPEGEVVYQDDFDGPLSPFWVKASPADKAATARRFGRTELRLNGPAGPPLNVEVQSKPIPLQGGGLEIAITDTHLVMPDGAREGTLNCEYYMELLDGDGKPFLRAGASKEKPAGLIVTEIMHQCYRPNTRPMRPGNFALAKKFIIESTGEISEAAPAVNVSRTILGTVRGVDAVAIRLVLKHDGGASFQFSFDRIEIRRLAPR